MSRQSFHMLRGVDWVSKIPHAASECGRRSDENLVAARTTWMGLYRACCQRCASSGVDGAPRVQITTVLPPSSRGMRLQALFGQLRPRKLRGWFSERIEAELETWRRMRGRGHVQMQTLKPLMGNWRRQTDENPLQRAVKLKLIEELIHSGR